MAYAKDKEKLFIQEGIVKAGIFTNPELIGLNANTPESFFTGVDIGHVKQGTINVGLTRSYAEFMSSTPGILVRKDLILKAFSMTFESGQFDVETMKNFKGLLAQEGIVFTSPATETHNVSHIGSGEPIIAEAGFLLDTKLVNGKKFLIGIYAGRMLGEDIGIALSGTDYAINATTIQAFAHEGFIGVTDETQKHYGFIDETIS